MGQFSFNCWVLVHLVLFYFYSFTFSLLDLFSLRLRVRFFVRSFLARPKLSKCILKCVNALSNHHLPHLDHNTQNKHIRAHLKTSMDRKLLLASAIDHRPRRVVYLCCRDGGLVELLGLLLLVAGGEQIYACVYFTCV